LDSNLDGGMESEDKDDFDEDPVSGTSNKKIKRVSLVIFDIIGDITWKSVIANLSSIGIGTKPEG